MADALGDLLDEVGKQGAFSEDVLLGFGEPGFSGAKLSDGSFTVLKPCVRELRTVFIDGGNAELFSSPGRCAHFIRVFHSLYAGTKRVSCGADEFFVLVSAKNAGGRLVYSAKLFRSRATLLTGSFFTQDFVFDSMDPRLSEGEARFSITRVPGIIRRLAELSVALLSLGNIGQGDMLVIDGDLCAKLADESKLLSVIRSVSLEKGIFVCGLSKTTEILASTGESVAASLMRVAPPGCWHCHPDLISKQGFSTGFVKLYPASKYIFRMDSFVQGGVVEENVSTLVSHSSDPVFLGYPYGLVEADRFARVSNREAESLRMMLMAKAGKDWDSIDSASRSTDAHSVLDRIS